MMEDSFKLLGEVITQLEALNELLRETSTEAPLRANGYMRELAECRHDLQRTIAGFKTLRRSVDHLVNYAFLKENLRSLIDVLDAESLRKVRDFVKDGIADAK